MNVEVVQQVEKKIQNTTPKSLLEGYKAYFQLLGVNIFDVPSPVFRIAVAEGLDASVSYQAVIYPGRELEHLQAKIEGVYVDIISVTKPEDEKSSVILKKRTGDGIMIMEGKTAMDSAEQFLVHKRCLIEEKLLSERCYNRLISGK